MENYNTQSRTFKFEGEYFRIETDGIECYLIRCIHRISKKQIEVSHWEQYSNPMIFWELLGLPEMISYGGMIAIPREAWADLSRQITTGENWQLEGKI